MLFPGHGAEQPRMGLELAAAYPRAAALLDHAGEVGGFDARTLLRRGGDRLSDTRVLQPLMTAVLLGIVDALAELGVRPDYALGYSLGELAAWSALGGIAAEQAIELAGVRGRALGALALAHPGEMLALPTLAEAELDAAIEHGRTQGVVDRAIHAGPDRWVLSGDRAALNAIVERVGGSFVATSGAWHCRRMAPARGEFEAALRELEPAIRPTPTLITNVDGALLGERSIIPALVAQLDGRVEFATGVQTLARALPADATLVLIGPPKPLRALIRANWPEPPRLVVAETPAEIAMLREVSRC
ncbi:ACP S-malonyltransferase [Nannocystaceae bacterium ST9]